MNSQEPPAGAARPAHDDALRVQRERVLAGVILPDLARTTGWSISYLLGVETGGLAVGADTYRSISDAIRQLVSEKQGRGAT